MDINIMRIGLVIVILWLNAAPASAQFHEPDPEARKAFAEMIEAYRKRPGLTVRTHIGITIREGDVEARSSGVEAEFILGRNRQAVVKLRGFTVYVGDGRITAVHDENPDAFFSAGDEGSPYYALLAMFMDLPFPHLAIALGEDDIDDLIMQFHPRAAWSRPTAVRTEMRGLEDGADEADEADNGDQNEAGDEFAHEVRVITMTSDFEEMEITVDPETQLIQLVNLRIFGGHFVQPNTEMILRHRFSYDVHDEPMEDLLAFDPGNRQRVDRLRALIPQREVAAAGGGGRRGVAGGGMIGRPAPPFDLERLGGDRVALEALRGRVVVLDFWATWCRPCVHALPMLHEVAAWGQERNMPLTILAINSWEIPNVDDNDPQKRREQVQRFWERHGFTLPVMMDFDDSVAERYGVQGLPTTIIIRPDGVIHTQHIGVPDGYIDKLKQDILDAIGETEM
jgi:thiol-disulfide isomerase/thioredoxin